jgi:ferredoxin--NADP+ reductase
MEIKRELNANLARPKEPVVGEVIENRSIVDSSSPHFCRHVTINVAGTKLEGNFDAGQAFGVIPEWEHYQEYNKLKISSEDQKLRLYSIAAPFWGDDGRGKTLSTTVKRVVDEDWESNQLFLGVASNYLCDAQVGDKIKMTGPTGKHFVLPDDDQLNDYQYVFVATGTGIAPFRGMVMELLEAGIQNDIHLIFGTPYSTDLLYGDLFREYDENVDNFHFHLAVSREQTTEDGEKMYVQRRLNEDWGQFESMLNDDHTLFYICGLKGMETGLYRVLLEQGCTDYFEDLPDELSGVDFSEISDRDDRLKKAKPNKDRLLVEVY